MTPFFYGNISTPYITNRYIRSEVKGLRRLIIITGQHTGFDSAQPDYNFLFGEINAQPDPNFLFFGNKCST
ncbi:MAG TPA: hypothetical protein PLI68_03975 [Bacteroidia bacterium]|nr:hypothetical protein [Bacteroidia bacterium]